MTADEIRKKYIDFFKRKKHKEIPPAPLVPPEDPTTLFTGFGMQQLVPYLKGKKHPMGTRLVNSQPCFRAEDIEEVGDNRHTTFFEMLGNWSLGDYFKEEQLTWFFEFLTKIVGLKGERLFITVFKGDEKYKVINENGKHESLNPDVESISIWRKLLKFNPNIPIPEGKKGFDPKIRIYEYDASENWWSRAGIPENMPPGEIGGTTSEVFYDFGEDQKLHKNSQYRNKTCHINCDCGRFLEIGNSVFMEYEKQKDGNFKKLPAKNVDFGGGLERIAAASQDTPDIFKTDVFSPIVSKIREFYYKGINKKENIADRSFYPTNPKIYENPEEQQKDNKLYKESVRVIADHLKASVFLIAEGVEPSNKEAGYVLRKFIRRSMVRFVKLANSNFEEFYGQHKLSEFVEVISLIYKDYYPQLKDTARIYKVIDKEQDKFQSNMKTAYPASMKVFSSSDKKVSGKDAFNLFQSHGVLPIVLKELELRLKKPVDWKEFDRLRREHSEQSRTASSGMFKGGLADKSDRTIKLHTATHLLHKALRIVLGEHVRQEGSHITAERLRFDFSHSKSMTDKEIKKVERLVNQKIKEDLPVKRTIEDENKALKSGALAFFKETYPKKVSVYTIGKDPKKDWFSKELCGGPHVKSTGEIGGIKIFKEKSIGSGLRRIYAILTSK